MSGPVSSHWRSRWLGSRIPELLIAAAAAWFWTEQLRAIGDPSRWGDQGTSPDIFAYYQPEYEQIGARLAAGILPSWNPWQLCGVPWLGGTLHGMLYPPTWLVAVLPVWTAMSFLVWSHLIFAAVCTVAFCRRVGLAPVPAMLAAVLFTFRGYLPHDMTTITVMETASWLPFGCLAIVDLAERPGVWPALRLAFAGGMTWLAGYPQNAVYLHYTWAGLLLAWSVGRPGGVRRFATVAALALAAVVGGLLLGAAQMLPSWEVASAGVRSVGGLPPQMRFFMGNPLNSPGLRHFVLAPVRGSYQSFGAVWIALMAVAMLVTPERRVGWWALGTMVLAGAIAVGPVLPGLDTLFDVFLALPGTAQFRGHDRLQVIAFFAAAVAAAVALDGLLRTGVNARSTRTLLPGLVPIAGALLLCRASWLANAVAIAPVLVLMAILMLLGLITRGRWVAWGTAALTCALLAFESFWVIPPFPAVAPFSREVADWSHAEDMTWRQLAGRSGHERVWMANRSMNPALVQKVATREHLRVIEDFQPLHLARQAQYFTFLSEAASFPKRPDYVFLGGILHFEAPSDVPPMATRRRLLDLAAVRWVVGATVGPKRAEFARFAAEARLQRIPSLGAAMPEMFENPFVLPRAFVTYRVLPAPPTDELLARIAEPVFDPLSTSYVEGDPGFHIGLPLRGHALEFTVDDETEVTLQGTLEAPGLVVLADSYASGWHATVDGVPAPILPTNHLFRGVPVAAGFHTVRFMYRPWTIPTGLTISALTAIAGLALAGWAWRRDRQTRHA